MHESQEWNASYIENFNGKSYDHIASILDKPNHFGKLLGPHLLVVMEIMSHNMLKAAPLRHNWPNTLEEIYKNNQTLRQIVGFNLSENFDPSRLTMLDYVFHYSSETPYFAHLNWERNFASCESLASTFVTDNLCACLQHDSCDPPYFSPVKPFGPMLRRSSSPV